jgi:hypothetical protein
MDLRVPVSVRVPHDNRSDLIGFALSSIRERTLKPAEILIVDDASSPEHRNRLNENPHLAAIANPMTVLGDCGAATQVVEGHSLEIMTLEAALEAMRSPGAGCHAYHTSR